MARMALLGLASAMRFLWAAGRLAVRVAHTALALRPQPAKMAWWRCASRRQSMIGGITPTDAARASLSMDCGDTYFWRAWIEAETISHSSFVSVPLFSCADPARSLQARTNSWTSFRRVEGIGSFLAPRGKARD